MDKKLLGHLGELLVKKYLLSQKFSFLTSNYRTRFGELDLIMRSEQNSHLLFTEVKTRTNDKFGSPGETLSAKQRSRIVRSIQIFLKEKFYRRCQN